MGKIVKNSPDPEIYEKVLNLCRTLQYNWGLKPLTQKDLQVFFGKPSGDLWGEKLNVAAAAEYAAERLHCTPTQAKQILVMYFWPLEGQMAGLELPNGYRGTAYKWLWDKLDHLVSAGLLHPVNSKILGRAFRVNEDAVELRGFREFLARENHHVSALSHYLPSDPIQRLSQRKAPDGIEVQPPLAIVPRGKPRQAAGKARLIPIPKTLEAAERRLVKAAAEIARLLAWKGEFGILVRGTAPE